MKTPKEILQKRNALFQILGAHVNDPLRQFQERVECAASVQYARGGVLLPRGFYCPSPVRDLIIGNSNRGKLLKKAPKVPPDYTYYFDELGQLSAVFIPSEISCDSSGMELITRSGNMECGLMFQYNAKDSELWPTTASLCEYGADGRISSYLHCIIYANSDGMKDLAEMPMHYEYERYSYQDNKLHGVDFYRVAGGSDHTVVVHNQYVFSSDDAGFFTEFVEVVPKERMQFRDILQQPHPVEIKRKASGFPAWVQE